MLKDINQLKNITWSRSYLWDINFPKKPPTGYNDWFPAVSLDEDVASLESYAFEGALSSFKIPIRTSEFSLKLRFIDDAENSLMSWISEWINADILNNEQYITALENCVRQVIVQKLPPDKNEDKAQRTTYLVYPEGVVTFSGTSEAGLHEYDVTFIIAGKIET